MSKVLYIGNIPFTATVEDLKEFCAGFTFMRITIPVDKELGRPRGFAFVELTTTEEAKAAIEALDGMDLGGRPVRIALARESRVRRDEVQKKMRQTHAEDEEDFDKVWKE